MSDPTLFRDEGESRDAGTVEGEVKSVLYEDAQKPWRVLRLRTPHGDLVTVGRFAEVSLGDRLRVVGRHENTERYGQRFLMDSYLEIEPDTLDGLVRYLGGGRFAGIGEASAKRIVDAFAQSNGAGALQLDGKMIDKPHLTQALRLLATRKGH